MSLHTLYSLLFPARTVFYDERVRSLLIKGIKSPDRDIFSHGWARDIEVDMVYSDMRRFNYSAGNIGSLGVVYTDYKRPFEFTATNIMTGASPTDLTYWFRRFNHSTHESNYNNEQLMKSNPLAMKDAIWSDPVWWDKE